MVTKTKKEKLKEKKDKKDKNRTFGENTSLGRMQDRMTELEDKISELEANK